MKTLKKLKVVLIIVLVLNLAAGGFLLYASKMSAEPAGPTEQTTDRVSQDTTAPTTQTQTYSTVSFLAVGDNLIHSSLYKQAAARAGDGTYDFGYAYQYIADYIDDADISILNQETLIAPGHDISSYPCFNSPEELGDEMLGIGFDVFSISTNHSLDKGESGLIAAINYWKNRAGATTTGAYLNAEDYQTIPTNVVNGVTVAYVGFTQSTNGLKLPDGSEVVLQLASDEAALEERIKKADGIADVVVVTAHWGDEYTHEPNESQKLLAQKISDWGADVIIGTHPHVIQPVEFITSSSGKQTLVAYSLGNFISAQDRGARMLGGMLEFDAVKNDVTGEVTITDVEFSCVVTHYGSSFADVRVYALKDYTPELAAAHGVRTHTSEFSLDYLKNIYTTVIDAQYIKQD